LPLDHTRSLIADLASALKIGALPPDASGGYQLTIGGTTTLLIYGGDDETILLVAPLGKLPPKPEYGLVLYLLRANMFNSDLTPFQIAVDEAGGRLFRPAPRRPGRRSRRAHRGDTRRDTSEYRITHGVIPNRLETDTPRARKEFLFEKKNCFPFASFPLWRVAIKAD